MAEDLENPEISNPNDNFTRLLYSDATTLLDVAQHLARAQRISLSDALLATGFARISSFVLEMSKWQTPDRNPK